MSFPQRVTGVVRLLRPAQWAKNVFVLLPVFFSGSLTDVAVLRDALVAFVSFCMASSAVYCLNDVMDVEADRQHPVKCKRPVASGAVGRVEAIIIMLLLAVGSAAMMLLLPESHRFYSWVILGVYLVLQVLYCLWLKHFALVDMLVVATGFVLRVGMGGTACGIWVSQWIVLMTFLLALFLVLSKRRDDVVIYRRTGRQPRRNTHRYNLEFIDQVTILVATTTLVCYIMYTVSPEVTERFHTEILYVTALYVLAGIMRYIQLMVVDQKGGSPTKILWRDPFIYVCVIAWALTFAGIIYL